MTSENPQKRAVPPAQILQSSIYGDLNSKKTNTAM